MNPLYSGGSSQNNVTTPNNSLNTASPSVRHSFNRFPNTYTHYTSCEYGEYTPFYVQECNASDKKKFKSVSQVRTLSLKTPLYSGMKMNKDYFFVPYDALLPFNWQKIFKNPAQGDDVPDDANTFIPDVHKVIQLMSTFVSWLREFGSTPTNRTNALLLILRAIPLMDAFFSASGLCARMGYNFGSVFRFKVGSVTYTSWDRFAEVLYPAIFDTEVDYAFSLDWDVNQVAEVISVGISSKDDVTAGSTFPQQLLLSPKDCLSIWRYFGDSCGSPSEAWCNSINTNDIFKNVTLSLISNGLSSNGQCQVFNYSRMAAYNICCSQFYTNGQVDSVYNAQLYRELLSSHIAPLLQNNAFHTFVYNGINTPYDYLSGHYFLIALNAILNSDYTDNTDTPSILNGIAYLSSIMCMQNSLKYGDYFTGSHTRPLAVGDVTAPVVDNSVSAVDMTKAISYQRFLNVVVKLKNDFAAYLSSIFGTLPAPDYHEAKFVSHSEGSVDGFEVANTSSADQGNLVTLLHSVNENYEFTLECDMPGISLGIVSFVASRAYSQIKDRFFMVRDRYDMFNPMLQTIGDQPILASEKSPYYTSPFGYQSRYMEYKQRVNIASGAFQDTLRSYCIISDSPYVTSNGIELACPILCPIYIRLLPRELDRFFVNQSAWSYGNSFHFICEFKNDVDDVRDADYSPSIL